MKRRFNFRLPIPPPQTAAAPSAPVLTTRQQLWPLLNHPRQWPLWAALTASFMAGLIVGLTVLGWWLWPVQWTNAWPVDLSPAEQALYLEMVSDLHAYTLDTAYTDRALRTWPDTTTICTLANQQTDWAARVRLVAIAAVKNGYGCPNYGGNDD